MPLLPVHLLNRAREMRHAPTTAEQKLWQLLRDRQFAGYKFRRQKPVPPFIADFYCAQIKLILELDGDVHADCAVYDAQRTRRLTRDGYYVIRFLNDDVALHLDAVLEELFIECERLSKLR